MIGIDASLQTGENPLLRFVFVVIGLLIVFGSTMPPVPIRSGKWARARWSAWPSAPRCTPSSPSSSTARSLWCPRVSQVSLRPAIAIPMFFGYAFGPVVGFFTGAVGNMFGDALTGFGLSPQWSIGQRPGRLDRRPGVLSQTRRRAWTPCLIISGSAGSARHIDLPAKPQPGQHAVLRCGQ